MKSGSTLAIFAAAALQLVCVPSAWAQIVGVAGAPNAAWHTRMVAKLKLNPAQESALRAYETALGTPTTSIGADQANAMTLPQRLDFVAEHMAADLAKQQAGAKAMRRLYALLSPDQQRTLDSITGFRTEHNARPPDEPDESDISKMQPNYALPSKTPPDWLVMPSGDDLSRVYPSRALDDGTTGKVMLTCLVDEFGYLKDCAVHSETPEGVGFGTAALESTAYMRMKPATAFGVPVRSEVSVPLNFAVEDDRTSPPDSSAK